jgi:hypothetical protein
MGIRLSDGDGLIFPRAVVVMMSHSGLLRLTSPYHPDTHCHHNARVTGELRVINEEMLVLLPWATWIIISQGIAIVEYASQPRHLFRALPACLWGDFSSVMNRSLPHPS